MNFQRKPAPVNVFGLHEDSYEVDELTFSEVIEITGITPVDSVQRKRQVHREAFVRDVFISELDL